MNIPCMSLVMSRGNLWVQQAIPLPLPLTRGKGFWRVSIFIPLPLPLIPLTKTPGVFSIITVHNTISVQLYVYLPWNCNERYISVSSHRVLHYSDQTFSKKIVYYLLTTGLLKPLYSRWGVGVLEGLNIHTLTFTPHTLDWNPWSFSNSCSSLYVLPACGPIVLCCCVVVVRSVVLVVFRGCVTAPGMSCYIVPVGRADTKKHSQNGHAFHVQNGKWPRHEKHGQFGHVFGSG